MFYSIEYNELDDLEDILEYLNRTNKRPIKENIE